MNRIVAYTDGSASTKNEKLGGFGVFITYENGSEELYSKGFKNTKTGRMELKALIFCLQKISDKTSLVHVYSDSEYVVKTISERRLWRWQRCSWIGIANPDLMIQLYEEYMKFQKGPKLFHIKGHTGKDDIHSLGNAIVDKLADYKKHSVYEQDLI